jgi:hypothetical protein
MSLAKLLIGMIALLSTVAVARSGSCQSTLPTELPPMPSDPEQWINSAPLTYEAMRGKGVVLWYFEETCPKCAGKWPGLLKMAASDSQIPVLFVAVSSGTSRRQMLAYADKHNIDWPIIIDADRSFERASGVNEISLQNIYTARVVTAAGKFVYGYWNDWPRTLTTASEDAKWKVNYETLHPAFHAAVQRAEFGDYRPAATAIRKGLDDKSPEVRKTATQLREFIERKMREEIKRRTASLAADDKWGRFTALDAIAKQFAPHELAKDEHAELERLSRDKAVQQELLAAKALDANASLLSSSEERERIRATAILQKVVKNYPTTRAAAQAKELLDAAKSTANQSDR